MSKTSPKKTETTSVIKPLIKVVGEKHVLEEVFEGPKEGMPLVKSIGYMKATDSKSGWVSYVITTKGREVVGIEVSEPDFRAIAEDAAKVSFVTEFMDQD